MLDVWHLNWGELLVLLAAAATNEQLAVELVQNLHASNVREEFHKVTTQRLHNYVAATMAVVDHVRRLMRERSGPIADEFNRRKKLVIVDPVVPFIQVPRRAGKRWRFDGLLKAKVLPFVTNRANESRISSLPDLTGGLTLAADFAGPIRHSY